jgi:flagellar FliL protein
VAGRQIQTVETIHPAKLSGCAEVKQHSVNHSYPTVTAEGQKFFGHASGHAGMASKPRKAEAQEADANADAEVEGGEAAPATGKFSRKTIMIAAAGALVLIGGGVAGTMMMGGSKEQAPATVQAKPAVFLDVPEVLVNLSSTGGERTQYLKVKVVLEVPDATMAPQIQTTMPRVMDAFQTYLRELRPTDLDGSAGLYRLKEELTRRVNAAIAPGRINAVLFKEIIVQ